jgi:ABC-2 type transport system ATP-binding protein
VLDAAEVTLESINLSRPTLDDVFLTLTGRSLRDDSPVHHAAGPGASGASGAPADPTGSAATAQE